MKHIPTFESFLNESKNKSFKVGDHLKDSIFNTDAKITDGPNTFEHIEELGYDLEEPNTSNLISDVNKKVWWGITFDDGTKWGYHESQLNKK